MIESPNAGTKVWNIEWKLIAFVFYIAFLIGSFFTGHSLKEVVRRIKAFEQMLLGTKSKVIVKDIDVRNYTKFILQEGTIEEKRSFLQCLKSDIKLVNKVVSVAL